MGWYSSSYFLTQTAFQPAFGHLFADCSVKLSLTAAVSIFELGSIVCATAQSSIVLILGRLIAGAGAAGLYVGTLAVVGHAVPIRRRPAYLSLVTSMFGVASVLGPILGGVFTDSKRLTWRFCFWINLRKSTHSDTQHFPWHVQLTLASYRLHRIRTSRSPLSATEGLARKKDVSKANGHEMRPAWYHSSNLVFCVSPSRFTVGCDHLPMVKLPRLGLSARICAANHCLFGSTNYEQTTVSNIHSLVWHGDVDDLYSASIPLAIATQPTVAAASLFLLFLSMVVGLLIYYIPFYFQAVLGTNAEDSGVRNLPLLVTMLFAPIASGALINFVGYYVPFMWIGALFTLIGSSLLFTIRSTTSKAALDGYQFLAGLGLGMCNQIPFSAVQYILPPDQMIMGSALVSFCNSLGPALGISIGQAIFAATLVGRLRDIPGVDAADVVKAGATNLEAVLTPEVLPIAREAYNYALTRAFTLAIACSAAALLCSLCMEWGNVKRKREHDP